MRAVPRSARVSPARIEISVVLPAPLGPSRPKNSPSSTSRSTPASASTEPKRRATPRTPGPRPPPPRRRAPPRASRPHPSLRGAVLCAQRLDERVDAAGLDLLVEFVAIVGDERNAADDHVVGLPRVVLLLHAVVD